MLATINTVDFLYTCPGHLADREFATSLGANETQSVGVTEEEIAKVKEEWEEKQQKKLEKERKEKAKEKEKEKETEKNQEDETKRGVKDLEREASKSLNVPSSLPTPTPIHERYALHRDYFASWVEWILNYFPELTSAATKVRLAEHRKRKQAAQARNLAPRLPGAPNGAVMEDKY